MKEFLTGDTTANQVRLLRTQFAGAFVIVEGDDDYSVYKGLLSPNCCQLVPAYGKQKALSAQAVLDEGFFIGAVTIVDSDFDRLTGTKPTSSNVALTDGHDLECLICNSLALDRVLETFTSRGKLEAFVTRIAMTVRQRVVESAAKIGYLLWASRENEWSLDFKELKFSKFVDATALSIDATQLLKAVRDKSQRHDLPEILLVQEIQKRESLTNDVWQASRGHDIAGILSFALTSLIGNMNSNDVTVEIIERSLRLTFRPAEFAVTELWKSLSEWSSKTGFALRLSP